MKKSTLYGIVALVLCATAFGACNDDETYAEKKEKERKAINSFLQRDVTIVGPEGDTLCHVGRIHPISEKQFRSQDSTTNLENNEYVLFRNTGIYMQIVRRGAGRKMKSGESKQIVCQFLEYNILGDSLQLNSQVIYWAANPEILDVTNTSGTYTATFNTSIFGGGAMYQTYGNTSVPSGWLTPLNYINVGQQMSSDEGIAKVRLIVPHSEGHSNATTSVYPCFYEITYQETSRH
ncbi:MAG: DUF4827 domain-containing protein [Bacteroidaceae bacterium]|nr:DUF4827 domain-containing protein [Bacteroidaceae bacterium]